MSTHDANHDKRPDGRQTAEACPFLCGSAAVRAHTLGGDICSGGAAAPAYARNAGAYYVQARSVLMRRGSLSLTEQARGIGKKDMLIVCELPSYVIEVADAVKKIASSGTSLLPVIFILLT